MNTTNGNETIIEDIDGVDFYTLKNPIDRKTINRIRFQALELQTGKESFVTFPKIVYSRLIKFRAESRLNYDCTPI